MNILLINVPSRKGKGGFSLPLGLLYVASIVKRSGHEARIYDPYADDYDLGDFDSNNYFKLDEIIDDYKPEIIGFGGIATSYGRTKKLSLYLANRYPDILQIAGGPLASVYDLLLTKTKIDYIFYGETEISLPDFLLNYSNSKPVENISGISFYRDNKIIRNDDPLLISDLDNIPLPEYRLIDLPKYLVNVSYYLKGYKYYAMSNEDIISRMTNKKYHLPMVTSRGCTHKCLFCYRHMKGVRQNSVDYVINHIKYLMETYGIDGFQFCDELFNSEPQWVMKFCETVERENLDIIYIIAGARIDKINEKMLCRLKETGCVEINYGHESGSDIILKEYRKGVNSYKNKEITLLTQKIGLQCPIQLVIGSPEENLTTILETVKFLEDIGSVSISLHHLIPLPMTPIWKYVEENGLIKNVEKFLDSVANDDTASHINLTKVPDKEWADWNYLIFIQKKLNYMKIKQGKLYYILYSIIKLLYRRSPLLLIALVKLIHPSD